MNPTLLLLAALTASPTKVALLPIAPGEGVSEKVAGSLSDAATAELRKVPGMQLVTQQEISTMLGFEKQKQLLGCGDDSCIAQIGGALGVDRIVVGSVSKLGESWLVTLKQMDVKRAKTLAQADRRLRKGTIDDVLDALPRMVVEIFGPQSASPGAPVPISPGTPAPTPAPTVAVVQPPAALEGLAVAADVPRAKALPLQLDEPVDLKRLGDDARKLELLTDGKGHYIAYVPWSTTFFHGDASKLWLVRSSGGGGSRGKNYGASFWDPRDEPTSFSYDLASAKVTCGSRTIPLKRVASAEASQILGKAQLLDIRWRRELLAVARDDDSGDYLVVERRREVDEHRLSSKQWRELRVFVGPKSSMEAFDVRDFDRDERASYYVTAAGKLKLTPGIDGEKPTAEWNAGGRKRPLSPLPTWTTQPKVYQEMIYSGQPLGTPCDWLTAK